MSHEKAREIAAGAKKLVRNTHDAIAVEEFVLRHVADALSALEPSGVRVGVKPLEWSECKALGGGIKTIAYDCLGNEFRRFDRRLSQISQVEIDTTQADYERSILFALDLSAIGAEGWRTDCHGLDTPERVYFYEQDFYVLSNFSAFTLLWRGEPFYTSEAAYHWEKFRSTDIATANNVRFARSAHDAFKIAERNKHLRRPDWDEVKVDIMCEILRAKAAQHEYVRRKLLATGDRELIENSWRDDFWGWGPNGDGQNMLGKLWMEIRDELRAALTKSGD